MFGKNKLATELENIKTKLDELENIKTKLDELAKTVAKNHREVTKLINERLPKQD